MPPLPLARDTRQPRGASLLVRGFMVPCNACLILLATATLGFAVLLFLNNCRWPRAGRRTGQAPTRSPCTYRLEAAAPQAALGGWDGSLCGPLGPWRPVLGLSVGLAFSQTAETLPAVAGEGGAPGYTESRQLGLRWGLQWTLPGQRGLPAPLWLGPHLTGVRP